MSSLKKISTTVLLLLVFTLLSACDSVDNKEAISDGSSEMEDATEIASNQGIENLEPVLTLDKALELFHSTFGNKASNIESIRFEKDDSENYRYFIEGWDEKYSYKLEIDVGTAEVIEQEIKIPVKIGKKLDLEAAITPKEAMDIALEGVDKEAVEDWELKIDQNNRMIYDIGFLSGLNREVDALSGKMQ